MGKWQPTQEYLDKLLEEDQETRAKLKIATQDLYKHTATAKIGDPEFEAARVLVVEGTKRLTALDIKITRVKKALLKLPELPFEE